MQANQILQASLLDIIFEGKNKDYGAYELRKNYNSRIYKAILWMCSLSLLCITCALFGNSGKNKSTLNVVGPVVELTKLEPPEKEKIKMPPQPPKAMPPVATIKDVTIKIVPDANVKPTDVIPPDAAIDQVKIGTSTVEGTTDNNMPSALTEANGTGKVESIIKDDNTGIVTNVQIQAKFPGGMDAWKRFLERNLLSDLPVENGAPVGRYTVLVSFVVDKDGNLFDIKAENDPGFGTAAEAVRVIKKSNQWLPAVQNGRNVTYRQRQSITFEVGDN